MHGHICVKKALSSCAVYGEGDLHFGFAYAKSRFCNNAAQLIFACAALHLTNISLSSFLWDIGKQKSPRCDAAKRGVPSGAILFAI